MTQEAAPEHAEPILRLRGIGRRFGGLHAVRDVDLDVAHGERRAILGPNGAGKTTLFNVISGDVSPSSGSIEFRSLDVSLLPPRSRAKLGMGRTYQKSRSFLGLTVVDNLYLAVLGVKTGHLRPVVLRRDRELRERAAELARIVGLEGREQALVGSLSHGEQRQLEVGMARGSNPTLMMLDEPASGLSRGERVALTELLLQLDPSITLILIEHDMDVALRVAERVTMMHDGRVIVEGTPTRFAPTRRCTTSTWAGGISPVPDSLLMVEGVSAFYGTAQALEDVSFSLDGGATAIVGRNGMGKTTLCNAIVGVPPARVTGSIRFQGKELVGSPSYKIAKLGIGYVPQGRRLFPSLSVDEHLRMLGTRDSSSRWTADRVYDLFPRLAERRRNGGAQLSGGEQQMLAIGRALLTNPTLLVMDEPSEGLAPAMIEHLIETFRKLEQEGLAILLIEQNLGMATAIAERQLVMVAGGIAAETTAAKLSTDMELQRRYLGVEPLAER